MAYYAGIGSRKTPPTMLSEMRKIAAYLAQKKYVLRSGGADGADKAFEEGCDSVEGAKEIYLPWKDFNDNKSKLYLKGDILNPYIAKAFQLASEYHPTWDQLSYGAKCLMARNGMQVLGQDLNTPVSFVVCWTTKTGGTNQALRIAKDHKIKVFNILDPDEYADIADHMHLGLDPMESTSYNLFESKE